ncbi:MAG: protein-tyrosine phosphatase family protein [Desulforhopalus sp.]
MSEYLLTWVTKNLAVGHAPMSYADLDSIKKQGIDAIVNLCEEFSDLHILEENAGFEVFYLPITDEHAPQLVEMEKGLEWLDEAMYLGKKVLVHCKHGIGRTGTFVTAYLLRRGLGLRKAEKVLKKTRANPTNFSQWWLLRKFGKKEGKLKVGEATADNRNSIDLSEFYARFEQLLRKIDVLVQSAKAESGQKERCSCGGERIALTPIEAIYLNDRVNRRLSASQRKIVIEKAAVVATEQAMAKSSAGENCCPLLQDQQCLLHQYRPIACRIGGISLDDKQVAEVNEELTKLSREIFLAISGDDINNMPPVMREEAISGKFIQKYFQYLAARKISHERP